MADKTVITPADVGVMPAGIAEGVGTAVGGRGHIGREIEAAMAQVVYDIQAECEEIWKDTKLDLAARQARIAELTSADAVRARKLAAREAIKRARFDAAAAAAAAAQQKAPA